MDKVKTNLSTIADLFDDIQTLVNTNKPEFKERVEDIRGLIEDLREDITP